jgi:hypothetical protein
MLNSGPIDLLDLIAMGVFVWSYVKEHLIVLPLPTELEGLKFLMCMAIASVVELTIQKVWVKFLYHRLILNTQKVTVRLSIDTKITSVSLGFIRIHF